MIGSKLVKLQHNLWHHMLVFMMFDQTCITSSQLLELNPLKLQSIQNNQAAISHTNNL